MPASRYSRLATCRPSQAVVLLACAVLVLLLQPSVGTVSPANAEEVAAADATALHNGPTHVYSPYGTLKYFADFDQFDYAHADAPKGGTLNLGYVYNFDSVNPFILKGAKPQLFLISFFDSFLRRSLDTPDESYLLLAESIEVGPDFDWVRFTLRDGATWQDGIPVTLDDVMFTFDFFRTNSTPMRRASLANVKDVRTISERTVEFTFETAGDKTLPQMLGTTPILPQHFWSVADAGGQMRIERAQTKPILSSGPYRMLEVVPGRRVRFERDPDYWAKDLPINVGHFNFDAINYEFFLNETSAFESFKVGELHAWLDFSAKNWATAYEFDAVHDGRVIKEQIDSKWIEPIQAFVLNLRHDRFADRRVRQALDYAYDFEWTNEKIAYGDYDRIESYFVNTFLASNGLPSERELEFLEPYRDQLPPELFTTEFKLPRSDGSGRDRANLARAQELLAEAGWLVKEGVLVHGETDEVFTIEFLLLQGDFERTIQPYIQRLKRLGIQAEIRIVDSSQYVNRLQNFDFDVFVGQWPMTLTPGAWLREYWTSAAADNPGSRNWGGIKDPVVDALTEKVIAANDRESLIAVTRALDRVLLWRHYAILNWYGAYTRIAYWTPIAHPDQLPAYNHGFPELWWHDGQ